MGNAVIANPSTPAGYVQRPITPALLGEYMTWHPVISALSGLSQLCFTGYEHHLYSIEENDDTQQKKIDQALPLILQMDARIGQVGRRYPTTCLGLARGVFVQLAGFRQAVVEKSYMVDGKFTNINEVQLLPGESFDTTPRKDATYLKADSILPGVAYDFRAKGNRYFQRGLRGGDQIEIDPDQVIYVSDPRIDEKTSMLAAISPSLEMWRTVRMYGMHMARRVGVPNEVAQIDAGDLKIMSDISDEPIDVGEIKDYAKDIVMNQGYDRAKLSVAGMRLQYPQIRIPVNLWDIDQFLKNEILEFWFHKDILKAMASAISLSSAPEMELLDRQISTERETCGLPFEKMWNDWLAENGFELRHYFDWKSWAPKDAKAEAEATRADVAGGITLIDEARKLAGKPPLTDMERQRLYEEMKARRGGEIDLDDLIKIDEK